MHDRRQKPLIDQMLRSLLIENKKRLHAAYRGKFAGRNRNKLEPVWQQAQDQKGLANGQ